MDLAHPDLGWWTRRAWRRQLTEAQKLGQQLLRFDVLAQPERMPLEQALHDVDRDAATLHLQVDEHRRWTRSHADLIRRINSIDHELSSNPEDASINVVDLARGARHTGIEAVSQGIGIEL